MVVIATILFFSATLMIAACGKKTQPVPPASALPKAITDLRFKLDEKGVTLQWTIPQRTLKGERITYHVKGFEIWRAVVPEDEFCQDCPVTYEEPIEISVEEYRKRGRITYSAAVLRPGHVYIFKVRTKVGWQMAGQDSNVISFFWQTPLEAPAALTARSGNGEVLLGWEDPKTLLDGIPYTGALTYQVYRSSDGINFNLLQDNIAGNTFADRTVISNTIYHYKVRALRPQGKTIAGGLFSTVVSVSTEDRQAPAVPQGVTVTRSENGVRVLWEAVVENDLSGYRIYRRTGAKGKAELVGEVNRRKISFVDTKPAPGKVFYWVTSFDSAQPANESSPSLETVLPE
jgi:hypothetical protein